MCWRRRLLSRTCSYGRQGRQQCRRYNEPFLHFLGLDGQECRQGIPLLKRSAPRQQLRQEHVPSAHSARSHPRASPDIGQVPVNFDPIWVQIEIYPDHVELLLRHRQIHSSTQSSNLVKVALLYMIDQAIPRGLPRGLQNVQRLMRDQLDRRQSFVTPSCGGATTTAPGERCSLILISRSTIHSSGRRLPRHRRARILFTKSRQP